MGDDLHTALEQNHRVCTIQVKFNSSWAFEILAESMKDPYPALLHLDLQSFTYEAEALVAPDFLLGGSAPSLESLCLRTIAFPALPKLLSSATGLICLRLWDIPASWCIFPETIVDCLSSLIRLEELQMEFQHSESLLNQANHWQHPPPLSPIVLPMFTTFVFYGVPG
jgi:hypothetical protein